MFNKKKAMLVIVIVAVLLLAGMCGLLIGDNTVRAAPFEEAKADVQVKTCDYGTVTVVQNYGFLRSYVAVRLDNGQLAPIHTSRAFYIKQRVIVCFGRLDPWNTRWGSTVW